MLRDDNAFLSRVEAAQIKGLYSLFIFVLLVSSKEPGVLWALLCSKLVNEDRMERNYSTSVKSIKPEHTETEI